MIFQGLEFLLTGFSRQKEKELEALIRQYGGYILINIPPETSDVRNKRRAGLAQFRLPVVLSPKKVCFNHSKMTYSKGFMDSSFSILTFKFTTEAIKIAFLDSVL